MEKRTGPVTELWSAPTLGGLRKEHEPEKETEKK